MPYPLLNYDIVISHNNDLSPKVGVIILSTDSTTEHDFYHLKNNSKVKFELFINRIGFKNPLTKKSLTDLLGDLTKTANNILPNEELDAIIFNCTSASAWLGDESIKKAIEQSEKFHSPVITTAAACVSEIKKHQCHKVDLLCPYSKEISLVLADYFISNGLDVQSLTYLNIHDDRDIAKITDEQIINAAKKANTNSSNGLFISCTGLKAALLTPKIEKIIQKKVFTSNYSTFNHLISLLKINQL